MKKNILYSLAVMASLTLASCNGDYDDWASPQTNSPEEAAAKYGVTFSAGEEADVNMATTQYDSYVNLVKITSSSVNISDYAVKSVSVNGQTVDADYANGYIRVLAQDLDNIVETENNSRAGVKRNIDVKSTVSAILANGDAVTIDMAGETTGSVTPRPVNVDQQGYYLLGEFTENSKDGNGWQPTAPVYMKQTAEGSGIYKAVVNTIKDDSNYYSIYGASSFVSGNWDEINKSVYGSPTADNSATEGLLVYTGDDVAHAPNGVKAMVIKGANKWQITFDANNLTYSVSRKYDDLFLTGSEYNWGKTASDWKQLTPVNGSDTDFWTIIYLHENEEIKFAPQAAWEGGDFGFIGAEKIHDEAGVGIVDAGGNLKVTNAGWYLIHVTNGETQTIEFTKPQVYVFGTAAGGKWDFDSALKCSIPTTEKGNFETPALSANAADEDDGLRLCVKVGDFEWWTTEFIVRDGKIEMRGNGGDQKPRVKVTEGQKVSFNFMTGTGEIK